MTFSKTFAICSVALALSAVTANAEGDAAAGEKVFKKCKSCHVVDSDKKKVGPSLQGVVGRTAGSVEGFKYSKGMAAAGADGLVWSDETLAGYLANPKKYIKGNKMSFAGLKKEDDVANIIAYLKQFSPAE